MPQHASPPPSKAALAPGAGTRRSAWRLLVDWAARVMPDPGLPLELRLFETISLFWVIVLLFFIIPSNFYLGLPASVNGGLLVYAGVAFWTWREARQGRIRAKTFLAGMMLVLHVSWFVSDGSHGSTGPPPSSAACARRLISTTNTRWR